MDNPKQTELSDKEKPECFSHELSSEAKKAAQSLGLELHHVDGFYFALGFDFASRKLTTFEKVLPFSSTT